ADDSAATSVKVGYRQASYKEKARLICDRRAFLLSLRSIGLYDWSSPIGALINLLEVHPCLKQRNIVW
ncbi:hypothetical protein, partial [Duganella callida]|uniref:hypothetical protein n=1 Tax=Duganella callida TaxID=2561932 RepID=UPI00197ADCC4